MTDFLVGVIYAAVYFVFFRFTLWTLGYEIRKKNRYKFKCPICEFSFSSNNQQIVAEMTAKHYHQEVDLHD